MQVPHRLGKALDTARDDHGFAMDIAVFFNYFPGVQADAHLHHLSGLAAIALRHVELDLTRTHHSATRRRERRHQTVAHLLDDNATMRLDAFECQPLDGTPDGARLFIAELLVELRGSDQIGEQHGDGALGYIAPLSLIVGS